MNEILTMKPLALALALAYIAITAMKFLMKFVGDLFHMKTTFRNNVVFKKVYFCSSLNSRILDHEYICHFAFFFRFSSRVGNGWRSFGRGFAQRGRCAFKDGNRPSSQSQSEQSVQKRQDEVMGGCWCIEV